MLWKQEKLIPTVAVRKITSSKTWISYIRTTSERFELIGEVLDYKKWPNIIYVQFEEKSPKVKPHNIFTFDECLPQFCL